MVWGLPGQKGKLLEGEVPPHGQERPWQFGSLLPDPPLGESIVTCSSFLPSISRSR